MCRYSNLESYDAIYCLVDGVTEDGAFMVDVRDPVDGTQDRFEIQFTSLGANAEQE